MIALHIKRNRPSVKWSAQLNNLTLLTDVTISLEVNAASHRSCGKDII